MLATTIGADAACSARDTVQSYHVQGSVRSASNTVHGKLDCHFQLARGEVSDSCAGLPTELAQSLRRSRRRGDAV